MKAIAIIEQLRYLHNSDRKEWAVFAELRAGTGYGKGKEQRIDLFAMHCWPSKSYRSVSYEVKVSRADFAREIDNPDKRKFAEQVSHECYFAIPQGLVSIDEVPEGWGLYEIDASGPKRTKMAQQRDSVEWPQSFVASLARRSTDPRPTIPVKMWRYAGKELTDKELIDLTHEMQGTALEDAVLDAKLNAVDRFKNSASYKMMDEVYRVVSRELGYQPDMVKAVKKAFETGKADTIELKLEQYSTRIDRAIEMLEGVKGIMNER